MLFLFWVAIFFLLIWLLSYPLTFKIVFNQGVWHFCWLPRVFAGYARPFSLPSFNRGAESGKGWLGRLFRYLLRRCRWHRFHVDVAFGEDQNPALAALLGGGVYALLGGLIPLLAETPCRPQLNIGFVSGQQGTVVSGECIISICLGNIMNDGLFKMPN